MSDLEYQKNQVPVDPDPITVAMLALAGASFALQCVQVWRESTKKSQPSTTVNITVASDQLSHLSTELNALRRHQREIVRNIEQGTANSDREFYDAPFRIGETIMMVSANRHLRYSNELGQAYGRVGNVATWINSIVGLNPGLAAEIGGQLEAKVPGAGAELNKLIASGGSIGSVVGMSDRVLAALEEIIEDLEKRN